MEIAGKRIDIPLLFGYPDKSFPPSRRQPSSITGPSGGNSHEKREDTAMGLIDNPEHARRLARAIISDVAIYNREKVEQGIKNDTIFELLENEIEEGRQHFQSRVTAELGSSTIFDLAIVDVLIKRAGRIESPIW